MTTVTKNIGSMPLNFKNVLKGALLISGTTIGAGMLGIPLVTVQSGFFPALLITFAVWLFMYITGLLFLEATLWMKEGSNILSMTERFLGKKGKVLAGMVFVLLYYCLMVAYFAAGAPILSSVFSSFFSINITGWFSYALFGLLFGSIVASGLHLVDRINYILMIGLIFAYIVIIRSGTSLVSTERFFHTNWKSMAIAAPVLFSAFGFHNIIPPLTFHYKKNVKDLRWAIFLGSFLPFLIYAIWQWIIIGAIPKADILEASAKGQAITQILINLTGNLWIAKASQAFGLFAIVTSMLGVSYSVYDFINDGIKMKSSKVKTLILTCLTFVPPFIMTMINPAIFLLSIGIAGGFGEAYLNGILPTLLVWKGRYKHKLQIKRLLLGGKFSLSLLLLFGFLVMLLELYVIFK